MWTHLSRDCPKPREERCRRCGQVVHDAVKCPQKAATSQTRVSGKFEVGKKVLRGFGGGACTAVGEVKLSLTVDGVPLVVDAFVAESDMCGADLWLTQPALAAPGVQLTVVGGKAQLSNNQPIEDLLLQPGEWYLFHSKRYETRGAVIAMSNQLMQGGSSGYVTIHNIGGNLVEWKKGEVLARGVRCNCDGRIASIGTRS
ncbi:hypothetical protein ABEB36_008340 [Hypothenemus hampei]|uniref:Uncharacterized protein n=1 Tax=Hypothenemus hampei TaxID=57062 RepID=A0ABD1ELK6_HYPHA